MEISPNLSVYVVHPIDRGGCSCTLHRNYLLPINNNLEQEKVKTLWAEMDPMMNQLKCHIKMMHCQLATQLNVDWKACLIHHHNSVNCLTQGWQNRSHRWRAPSWQGWTCSTKVKLKKNQEPSPMEVSEFCITAEWHPFWCLQYLGWPMHLHIILCMHMVFAGNIVWAHSIQTITNLPNTYDSWHYWGYHPCQCCCGFWRWGLIEGYLVQSQLPHWRNQKDSYP